jgi:hypothetical protein
MVPDSCVTSCFENDYDFNYGTGSGGENIYSGKFTGINHLAWCEICYIVEMLEPCRLLYWSILDLFLLCI